MNTVAVQVSLPLFLLRLKWCIHLSPFLMKTGSGGTTVSVRVADCEVFPLVAVIVTV